MPIHIQKNQEQRNKNQVTQNIQESEILASEAKKQFEFLGNKLGLLLSLTNFSMEEKESVLAALAYLPPEEIDRFMSLLETKILEAQTKDVDEDFEQELRETVKSYEGQKQQLDQKTLEELNDLEQSIQSDLNS